MSTYICNSCYEVYDGHCVDTDLAMCPKKNCTGNIVEIDELLIPTIIMLNRKGYVTEYCCSGHYYEDYPNCYITFYADMAPVTAGLPRGFKVEYSGSENQPTLTIRRTFRRRQERALFTDILNTAIRLYDWALLLPENPEA